MGGSDGFDDRHEKTAATIDKKDNHLILVVASLAIQVSHSCHQDKSYQTTKQEEAEDTIGTWHRLTSES